MALRLLDPGRVFKDAAGNILSGGTVTFYTTGTTTLLATYSDISQATQNANPITIDSDGRLPVEVFGSGTYSIRVADSNGTTIWTENDIAPAGEALYHTDGTEKVLATSTGGRVDGTVFDVNNSGATTAANARARNSVGGIAMQVDSTLAGGRIAQTDSTGANEDAWITMVRDDGVTLYHNNTAKLATGTNGIDVTGTVIEVDSAADSDTILRAINTIGGIVCYVQATTGTGIIRQTDSSGVVEDTWIAMTRDGAVTLYNNNTARLATNTSGITLNGAITWTSGTGSPEGVVTAGVGSLYSRTDGGAGTTLYVKESGVGNTGWAGV